MVTTITVPINYCDNRNK